MWKAKVTKRPEPEEPFERITVEKAKEMLERGGVQLIDVREPWEYAQGHIKGALLNPVGKFHSQARKLKGDRDLIFVCAVGVRSAFTCEVAAAVGYTTIYNVEGGMDKWVRQRYPVELGEPQEVLS